MSFRGGIVSLAPSRGFSAGLVKRSMRTYGCHANCALIISVALERHGITCLERGYGLAISNCTVVKPSTAFVNGRGLPKQVKQVTSLRRRTVVDDKLMRLFLAVEHVMLVVVTVA